MHLTHVETQSSLTGDGGISVHGPVSKELGDLLESEDPGLACQDGRGDV